MDTGVSLSTHTSPINTDPIGIAHFLPGKGSGKEGSQGVMMMSQQEMKDRIVVGKNTANE